MYTTRFSISLNRVGKCPQDEVFNLPISPSAEELLRNAAKARIRRMIAVKTKRTDLEVPGWVGAEWRKGTRSREQMASCLQEVNWDKAWIILWC